mmetsp:Transcript_89942/g.183403  ORF Transcript_89942/g.183403 Transcript_89942/m.183403 type:complete len:225 (+) Transcript_89942:254-928(+)
MWCMLCAVLVMSGEEGEHHRDKASEDGRPKMQVCGPLPLHDLLLPDAAPNGAGRNSGRAPGPELPQVTRTTLVGLPHQALCERRPIRHARRPLGQELSLQAVQGALQRTPDEFPDEVQDAQRHAHGPVERKRLVTCVVPVQEYRHHGEDDQEEVSDDNDHPLDKLDDANGACLTAEEDLPKLGIHRELTTPCCSPCTMRHKNNESSARAAALNAAQRPTKGRLP